MKRLLAALFSLDDEGPALLLAVFVIHHATAILDPSAISANWIGALTALFPLWVWVLAGVFGGLLLGTATLGSLVEKTPFLLRARMAGAAWIFVFYLAFGYAQWSGGATWLLVKIYAFLAVGAFILHLALYLDKHPPQVPSKEPNGSP